jgi:Mn2+/Fe2+ NRAMP family transporter
MRFTRFRFLPWLTVLGPGLLVMLADTDAGSLIISAQSGAVWGYKLLMQQIILIPVLYIAQELAVRLGLGTGMGHGELIKRYFGRGWALLSVSTLAVCCVGALLTEFTGLAAVGQLFGVPVWETMILVVSFLGVFELVFIGIAWHARPSLQELSYGFVHIPWNSSSYLYLFAGNIGAVIMPWMIFFQQSAVLDKKLNITHLKAARWDTAIGAIITQIIMMSLMVITAATIGKTNPQTPLNTVVEISDAITPLLGATAGRILFALGMAGAALVATIVVSLTAAWGVGEVLGFRRSLEDNPKEAPWFYGIYTLVLILGAVLVTSNIVNLVSLSVAVEVMNTLLLPIVLGFLYLLARRTLPDAYRLKGWYAWVVGIVLLVTSVAGFIAGMFGIFQV